MKRTHILPVSALAVIAALSGTIVATAQTAEPMPGAQPAEAQVIRADYRGGHGGRHDDDRRGHGERRGGGMGGEMFRQVFDAADADGDGTVTAAEIDAYRTAQIGAVDASGDGSLSIEEFDELYRSLTRTRMVDIFQDLDADGDGQITPAEIDTRMARLIERLDRDGDGSITMQRPGQGPDFDDDDDGDDD